MSCEGFKHGDWFLLDDWDILARVDSFDYSNPSVIYLQMFEQDGYGYSFQYIRVKDHRITKITKEVADIMREV